MQIDSIYFKAFLVIIVVFNGLMGYIQVFTNTTFFFRQRNVNFVVTWRRKYPILMKVLELFVATFWVCLGVYILLYFKQV